MQYNLLILRKLKNLKQEDMAELLGMSVGAYGMRERGEVQFGSDEMFVLRDYFQLPMEQIFLPRNLGNTEVLKGGTEVGENHFERERSSNAVGD